MPNEKRLSYAEIQQKLHIRKLSRSLDALAYDKISASPTQANHSIPIAKRLKTESLLSERKASISGKVVTSSRVVIADIMSGKQLAPGSRAWIDANSIDGILLPTGANSLCPKCGYNEDPKRLGGGCYCDMPKPILKPTVKHVIAQADAPTIPEPRYYMRRDALFPISLENSVPVY